VSNVGVGAHITAAAAGGPRFDKRLTAAERSSADNGIWMCGRCGRLVDNDAVNYSVGLLRRWKRQAILRARKDLERGDRNPRLQNQADVLATFRAAHRAEREAQIAQEAVMASHRVLDTLANAHGTVGAVQRDPTSGAYLERLRTSIAQVEAAGDAMKTAAGLVEGFWDASEATPAWRVAGYVQGQLNGMRALLARAEATKQGAPWQKPDYGSAILDGSYSGSVDFVCEVEMLVADVDGWADGPLGRVPADGVRYQWPG
jgi:hypothetical protein